MTIRTANSSGCRVGLNSDDDGRLRLGVRMRRTARRSGTECRRDLLQLLTLALALLAAGVVDLEIGA